MIQAESFARAASDRGFGLWTGVPCSYLTPFINYVIDDQGSRYVAAANEGDAVAIAAGASLGGGRAIAMFQNSGLGNAVNPLTSLTHVFRIPMLLIVSLRGEPGGPADEPQHELMGAITTGMLELMEIPWAYFPTDVADVNAVLDRALEYFARAQRPFALVMRKGSVASHGLRSAPQQRPCRGGVATCARAAPRSSRKDCLEVIQASTKSGDLILATTGYASRELYACEDRPNQFYMVGSMGCIASVGLGLALTRPDRRIFVLDGDGSLLMRMGALSTIGYEQPKNLMHILLDNEQHESTGGQSTLSHSVDFCSIAAANGYPVVEHVKDAQELGERIRAGRNELTFLHLKIRPGVPENLPRPKVTPVAVAARLRQEVGESPC